MTSMRSLLLVVALVVWSGASARAETRLVQVTVDGDQVRFAVEGGSRLLRVKVTDLHGRELFDGRPVDGQVLEWNRQIGPGARPSDEIYVASVTISDESGQILETTEQVIVAQELQGAEALEVAGTGTVGKIAKWTAVDALGNSVITESSGRIGIAKSSPSAVLHVSGSQPATRSGPGASATRVLEVRGGKGGNTTDPGSQAGYGASVYIRAGDGGQGALGGQNGGGGWIHLVPGNVGTVGSGGIPGNVQLAPSSGLAGGRVVIGTTTPDVNAKLTVVSGANIDGLHARSTGNIGVAGFSGSSYGVYGTSTSGTSVYGTTIGGIGVGGFSTNSYGVSGGSTNSYGVFGFSSSSYAGYFSGPVRVTGSLTKGGGSFQIDHPLDPANKYLAHSFVESPDMMNIYNGVVALDDRGEALVRLPVWFEALNNDFRYQLTCVGGYAPVYVAEEVQGNQFKIAGGKPGLKVSWQVTGVRQDAYARAHRVRVEEDKPENERGYYLHPVELGQPAQKAIDRERRTLTSASQAQTTSPAGR